MMASTQPHGLNRRYNLDGTASPEFRGAFVKDHEEAKTAAPALNLSAEALPATTADQPMVPEALGERRPDQPQRVMNASNDEAQDRGRAEDALPGVGEGTPVAPPALQPGEYDEPVATEMTAPLVEQPSYAAQFIDRPQSQPFAGPRLPGKKKRKSRMANKHGAVAAHNNMNSIEHGNDQKDLNKDPSRNDAYSLNNVSPAVLGPN